ncbi:hypothetical protein KUTeg_011855 [Tegillarca granosa]|uniref:Uncharacterized protein n=1 Tax=Tegillarca granosa TaxID=220873 RepID=A0ABQ9F327_TEGGR|nr:hypothetical protein KUTeg_011855 [Tegillarca granosa]
MIYSHAYSASTLPPSTSAVLKYLYDFAHHKAFMVKSDGCYEYHMNHHEVLQAQDNNLRHLLEAKMVEALANATVHEIGHHSIDHLSSEIKTACASVPVYSFESHPN